MIYRHEFFSLNSGLQIAYDIHNNEIHVVGDAYTLLLALCEKSAIDMLDAKGLLGIDKNYEGRRIHENVEKINHAVGKEIVKIEDIEDEFEERTYINLKGDIIKEN